MSDETTTSPAPVDPEPRDAPADAAEPVAESAPEPTPAPTTEPAGSGWNRWVPRYSYVGLVVAFVFLWLSMTPTLIPRAPVFQGLVGGASAAIGYAFGVLLSVAIRTFMKNEPTAQTKARAWKVLWIAGAAISFVALNSLRNWQIQLQNLMGMEPDAGYSLLFVVIVSVVIFWLILAIAKGLRRASRWTGRQLGRILPRRVAGVIGGVVVAALAIGLLNGVVVREVMNVLNNSFQQINEITEDEVNQPTSTLRSGGPASLADWNDLGRLGQRFVGTGPTVQEISTFTGAPATEPIRAYAGLDYSDDAGERADLAVRELIRTGAFDRQVLAVAGSTGTGWVDENSAAGLELMYGGDTAIVSTQYSFLPSWLSFLVDKARAREAGSTLFDAVYAEWSQRPENDRPKLVVFGESLGSFAAEAAFSGVEDLRARTDGALFLGPPSSNEIWSSIVADRQRGTPQWLPIFQDGQTVRFAVEPDDLENPAGPWDDPRIVYLQHASDPITWWSPDLLFSEPPWLRETRGPDVLNSTRWFPFITFLQVSADMAVANSVPDGHGHKFGTGSAEAWARMIPPAGWTAEDTAKLATTLEARN